MSQHPLHIGIVGAGPSGCYVADALGRPGGSQSVTVAGRSTTTYLRRWEWLQIDLLFPGQESAGEWPTEETANA